MKHPDLIKGQRVFLNDLVEAYPGECKKYYATYHKDTLMDGPFYVIAAGTRCIAVHNLDGTQEHHYTGDIGLRSYSQIWNPSNAIYEMLPRKSWIDDWM